MVESNPIALDRRLRRRISALFIAVVMALGMVAFTAPQSAEAQACQAYFNRAHTSPVAMNYYMGISVPKAASGCQDVNISWASNSGSHRGQYQNSAGNWVFSNVGVRNLSAGTQNPWAVVVSNVSSGTRVRAGSLIQNARTDWRV